MAKLKFGAIVNDARGSIDGIVYSKNQYGAYARVKVSPVQPRTSTQIATRAIFAEMSTAYSNTLTDAQRSAWKLFATNNPTVDVFGNSKTLSALAMYQSVNSVLKHAGVARIDDPPANMDVTALLTATVASTVALQDVAITFTATPLGATHRLYVYATSPLPGGVSFIENRLKLLSSSAAAAASPVNMGADYVARFGALIAGQRIGILVATVNTDNGAVSVGVQSIITVV